MKYHKIRTTYNIKFIYEDEIIWPALFFFKIIGSNTLRLRGPLCRASDKLDISKRCKF